MEIEKFRDRLIDLKVILEKIKLKDGKIEIIEKLEIVIIKQIARKGLKELEIKRIDESEDLERNSNFMAIKNRF